jgi:hypothetical protein
MKRFTIDLKTNRIEFLDNRFYRDQENGELYPSVTTILQAYPKNAAFFEWLKNVGQDADEIRDAAGKRGSNVHGLTEKYDNGEICTMLDERGYPAFTLTEWAMFSRYVDFSERFKPQHQAIEITLLSSKEKCAGTADRVTTINGKTYLLDIKTSNSLHNHYWLQLAIYRQMLQNLSTDVDGVGILWLNAKTRTEGKKGSIQGEGWQLLIKEDTSHELQLFRCTRELWIAENGDMQPKNISYQISYENAMKLL